MLISIERDTYRATQAEMVSNLGILTFETIYHTSRWTSALRELRPNYFHRVLLFFDQFVA